jgi:nicotinamide mononucleotide transporter
MSPATLYQSFIDGLLQTSALEFIAVLAGIASVWFSKKEQVLVYPVGLINTTIFVYLSFKGHLLGEASVNIYYTVMSVYGWWLWTRKNEQQQTILQIQFSSSKEVLQQLLFFAAFYVVLYTALYFSKTSFAPGAIPWADALSSAAAYTGMWLMAKKKVESWYYWIATNIFSIPLYFVKGYVFTSVQFAVLLALAVAGLIAWRKKAQVV